MEGSINKLYIQKMLCPKCGSDLMRSEYIQVVDQIKRTCSDCGYEEYQIPLDRNLDRNRSL